MAIHPILLATPAEQTARLVERLLEMREEALDRMLRRCAVEPNHLPLIAGINAVLETLGGTSPARAERAVVDAVGGTIRLTLYAHETKAAIATVVLDPISATALAGRLIEVLAPWLCTRPR
jgi:hypothetical protein